MRKFLSFLLTIVFLMLSTTALAQKQYKCMYCGSRGTSISELAKRKCRKSPDGTCLAIYNGKTLKSKSTKSSTHKSKSTKSKGTNSSTTSSYTTGKSYPSPLKGDTITINGKKYILSSLEKAIKDDFGHYIYRSPKYVSKHIADIYKAMMNLWNGLKSGRVEYEGGGHFTDYEGVYGNASNKKEDYYGTAAHYLGKELDDMKPITPRSRTRGYFSYNSISEIQKRIDNDNDAFCGIYKGVNYNSKTVACIKSKGEYYLVCVEEKYYHYNRAIDNWLVGDIVARLERTASTATFSSKTLWDKYGGYDYNRLLYFISFDGTHMYIREGNKVQEYMKIYPVKSR